MLLSVVYRLQGDTVLQLCVQSYHSHNRPYLCCS